MLAERDIKIQILYKYDQIIFLGYGFWEILTQFPSTQFF